MKRHSSLHPLSHDHHHGLVQARRLRAAADRNDACRKEAAQAFRTVWREEIEPHFEREERLLLPYLDSGQEAERLRREHAQLRAMAAATGELDPASMRDTAQTLDDHIRWEERELFPMIERTLSEEQLTALGDALRR